MCEPYGYEAMQNSSLYAAQCGGADKWAGVSSTNGIFCPTSHFCPLPVRLRNCTVGREGIQKRQDRGHQLRVIPAPCKAGWNHIKNWWKRSWKISRSCHI